MNKYKLGIYQGSYESLGYTPRYIEYAHVIRSYESEFSPTTAYLSLTVL